jgi:IS1 family transposase
VMHLLVVVGAHCERVMDKEIRNVPFEAIEADEIWGYVAKKEGHKKPEEKADTQIGDAYTFVAIDAKTKLVACHQLGRRDLPTALTFMRKLQRVAGGRFQLTTDGLSAYRDAVEKTFGAAIDFAQLIKEYKSDAGGPAERRYSPGDFVSAKKVVVMGDPDTAKISTSYIERQNLTMRMSMRRLTRLTNGFSKKWENLNAALALHIACYNFCRVHQSLRVTPAMEAGITDHVWTLEELVSGSL